MPKLTWIGHSAFLLEDGEGNVVAVDPFIKDNPVTDRDVRDVRLNTILLTHAHNDHFGSLNEVARRAPTAIHYSGAPDVENIERQLDEQQLGPPERRLRGVADGDEIFGLEMVTTPGHTRGHVAVFDADSAVLVAGDALTNTFDGVLAGSLPEVTWDPVAAADSVRKLAALKPQVILVGHGPPVERDAAAKLRRLANA